ncbi:GRAS family protein TF80-like isoform X2 [Lotus japonicus]|uniref:GRAS family protein TF80-like isoform X2 n=1 Tax=Lotus japonicus TaxID=34305 RepID=UPI00258BC754|nr:GRAS family protein TF80-like isoform X2 [Lotus japonicus]
MDLGSIEYADNALEYLAHIASPYGDAMQRVATYVSEGLAFQVLKNLKGVPKALSLPKTLSTSEELLVKNLFFQFYPFLKIAYVISSHAIAEAMKGEEVIHVIDLSASEAAQWIYLMQRLKEQQKKPLLLKITAIHEKKEVLEQMALHLGVEAQKFNFHLQFNAIVSSLENLDLESLPVEKGEPLAISSVLQLHSLLATDDSMSSCRNPPSESMNQSTFKEVLGKKKINQSSGSSLLSFPICASSPKMEGFLNGLRKLQPRLVVITEQESNVNGSSLTERVDKALDFYGALFKCLESTFLGTAVERIMLERTLLGDEIKNIVACEGVERKERHEKLETWIPRLELAGFGRETIRYDWMMQAKKELQGYGNGYKLLQENKCLFVCWNDKPLFSVSAWKVY